MKSNESKTFALCMLSLPIALGMAGCILACELYCVVECAGSISGLLEWVRDASGLSLFYL